MLFVNPTAFVLRLTAFKLPGYRKELRNYRKKTQKSHEKSWAENFPQLFLTVLKVTLDLHPVFAVGDAKLAYVRDSKKSCKERLLN